MSTDTITPESWRNQAKNPVDLWIGGFRKEAQEYIRELQAFPPEGCRIPLSREFPGIVEETLRHSWCFVAYPLTKGQQPSDAEVPGYYVVYRADIDETDRAKRIRRQREQY